MKISSLPHGCVGVGPDRPIHVLDWLTLAAHRGLDGVEIMDQWVMRGLMEKTETALMRQIKQKLSELKLPVSAFINHGPHIRATDEENRRELAKTRFFMDWATELGTKVFRVTTAAKGVPDDVATDRFCQIIEELLPEAKARGLVIVLEEHPGIAGTVAKMEPICQRITDPAFGLAYDTKNTLREGESPFVILDKPAMLKRVLYTHIDNFRNSPTGWDRSVTIDAGEVNLRPILAGLRRVGYDGWLCVEYGGTNIEHVFQSVTWLRQAW